MPPSAAILTWLAALLWARLPSAQHADSGSSEAASGQARTWLLAFDVPACDVRQGTASVVTRHASRPVTKTDDRSKGRSGSCA